YDEFGRLTQEKNRLDGTQNYTYNENTEFSGKKDFEGNMTAVVYDTRTRTRKTSYADGTESIIVYDACGNIISATNESGTDTYTYNKAGKLIKQIDGKTGDTLNYTYDKAGRKSSLSSDKRKILYAYGKNDEILTVKDTIQNLAVSYTYDKCGREIERRFANGVVQKTRYDKAGRAVSIAQYNRTGQLISGEAYVYDETGRRTHTVNDKGLVTIYKYDNQSRLQTVFYPFNEDIKETARKEADKQGLYFLPSQGNAENYFLSSSEMIKLRAAAENLARARGNSITVNQVVWKESYTYDANGNRTSKTTAWGTISYSYDKENRLTESGELGKSESVKYTYDKNGNLLKENSPRYRKEFEYNAQNRMSLSHVQDFVEDMRNIAEYDYDAFGRRVETYQYLGDYTRNLYDGLSFDIVSKSVLQSAYSANLSDQKYRTPNRQSANSVTGSGTYANGRNERGTDIGTRYRYIDDTPLVPIQGAGNNTNSSVSANGTKTRSRPNNEYVLYSYGEPVAMTNDSGTLYFGPDILGSVRNVTDKYGTVQSDYSYDAFGSPYLGNLENDIGFGYCGKSYDTGTGLYDYGFRDYSPVSARFTTIDPIRDGANWFSYVVNDPVNYIDSQGLRKLTTEEKALHKAAGGGSVDYNKINFIDRKPTVQQVRDAATKVGVDMSGFTNDKIQAQINDAGAMSLPDGTIYVPKTERKTQERLNALTAHEIEHQSQYQNGNPKEIFYKLIDESQITDIDVYETPGYLEYQAQQVEEKAIKLYENGWKYSVTGVKNK
ncbi:MAG: RHS repeat-associated core domain-containing protein, partial [Spirochaetaceae bacterium]|nr:RHS repeat-associated core domain-containing protein [Spirochaetaceae bacterium]